MQHRTAGGYALIRIARNRVPLVIQHSYLLNYLMYEVRDNSTKFTNPVVTVGFVIVSRLGL